MRISHKDKAISLKRRRILGIGLFLAVLGIVLAGGIYLFQYVAKNPILVATKDKKSASEPEPALSAVSPRSSIRDAKHAEAKKKTEKLLSEFLLAKDRLDDKGASLWRVIEYGEMVQSGQEADRLFAEQSYAAAALKYEEAIHKIDLLNSQTQAIFDRILEEGRRALEAGDGNAAQQSLAIALRIDPQNQQVQKLLSRAKHLDAVMALMASAKQHEKKNELTLAQADYQKVLRLDPGLEPARNALNRLSRLITDKRFEQHMSSGISALQRGADYTAQDEFIKAKDIKPTSPEVKDALAQVDSAIRLKLIQDLKKEAAAAEQSEDWKHAVDTYLAVLKIDNSLQFAIQGKARSLERLHMDKRLQYYLENTHALESDSYLKQAVDLLEQAGAVSPKGPRIHSQIEKLKPHIQIAQTPVNIILESDNLTDVAVYKVGKLGKFMQRELHLRPGTYTIVGVRNGYKDVRQKIIVKPKDRQRHITIRCEEEI